MASAKGPWWEKYRLIYQREWLVDNVRITRHHSTSILMSVRVLAIAAQPLRFRRISNGSEADAWIKYTISVPHVL